MRLKIPIGHFTPPAQTGLKKACGWRGLNHRAADERVNPLPYELAQAMEPELARQLRADGVAVWPN